MGSVGLLPRLKSRRVLYRVLYLTGCLSTELLRRAASAKAAKDGAAFVCKICRQTFMCNAKPSLLYLHVTAKHPDKVSVLLEPKLKTHACYDEMLNHRKHRLIHRGTVSMNLLASTKTTLTA